MRGGPFATTPSGPERADALPPTDWFPPRTRCFPRLKSPDAWALPADLPLTAAPVFSVWRLLDLPPSPRALSSAALCAPAFARRMQSRRSGGRNEAE